MSGKSSAIVADIRYWRDRFVGVRPEILPKNRFIFMHLDSAQQIAKAKTLENSAQAVEFLKQHNLHDQAVDIAIKKLSSVDDINKLLAERDLPSNVRFILSNGLKNNLLPNSAYAPHTA